MFKAVFSKKEEGQGLVEYALVLVLVAVVVIAILTVLGPQIGNVFSRVMSGLGASDSGGTTTTSLANEPTDFGSSQWKNGWDKETPINNYCASEGSNAKYNLYHIPSASPYYIASGFPWTQNNPQFLNTGTCP